jgi:zinc transport system ATP-binding protein
MSKTAIHIEHLSVYYGRTAALQDVCLDVRKANISVSSDPMEAQVHVAEVMLGLVPADAGTVKVYGEAGVRGAPPVTSRSFLRWTSASDHAAGSCVDGTAWTWLTPFFRYTQADLKAVEPLMERVGIARLAHRRISDLSGGEFQKMLIIRALAAQPSLLLLDEPTASVDAAQGIRFRAPTGTEPHYDHYFSDARPKAISAHVRRLACLNEALVYHGEPQLTIRSSTSLWLPGGMIAHGVPHRGCGSRGGGEE